MAQPVLGKSASIGERGHQASSFNARAQSAISRSLRDARRTLLRRTSFVGCLIACLVLIEFHAMGQQIPLPTTPPAEKSDETAPVAPAKVDVLPEARDDEIRQRLANILNNTGWFSDIDVSVAEGVVVLDGEAATEQYRKWAGDLARNTQDVAAVVNRLEVAVPPVWELRPALEEMRRLWLMIVRALPRLLVGLLVIALFWFLARGARRFVAHVTRRRLASPLLRDVLGKAAGLLFLVIGFYLALQLVGLARLAVTVIGGTGLIGLVIGIAFRDITENFLASIYLSVQRPFRSGDLIDIAGSLGYVQRLTTRTTVIMTLDGNHVQIPNAIVFKSTLRNYTSNPKRREDFVVGIGYGDSIAEAQRVAMDVLVQHPAVLKDPEPWVLAEGLGAATVNLRIYLWLDGREHSWLKVRSSVIRLVKRAFQEAGISMPDAAREVVFPEGVPVRMIESDGRKAAVAPQTAEPATREPDEITTDAEAGLDSEADEINRQALSSRSPEEGAAELELDNSIAAK